VPAGAILEGLDVERLGDRIIFTDQYFPLAG
jgi:hypothetical protein